MDDWKDWKAITLLICSSVLGIGLSYFLIAQLLAYMAARSAAHEMVKREAVELIVKGKAYVPSQVKDPWGSELTHHYVGSQQVNTATVTSAGPDRKLGTRDDITVIKTDINKSRALGKYLGERLKEVVGGAVEGVTHPQKKHERQ